MKKRNIIITTVVAVICFAIGAIFAYAFTKPVKTESEPDVIDEILNAGYSTADTVEKISEETEKLLKKCEEFGSDIHKAIDEYYADKKNPIYIEKEDARDDFDEFFKDGKEHIEDIMKWEDDLVSLIYGSGTVGTVELAKKEYYAALDFYEEMSGTYQKLNQD